ncbi:MerR family transcriptional regulator [Streptomyces albus]|uniref:MerR family transcriptional regulator n=1 Tax=Streptomyces sp. PHES57 TaxID=2872626 RepID=UPI001CED67E1|nr:MerR family transcriptional regulator [Streptomyces sp. PHES57]
MTHHTWSIGQLSSRTGLPVKTIRYYSDIGLLPVAERSTGGHRRYSQEALELLALIRRLRALEMPVATIASVAAGELSLSALVADELEAVGEQLAGLRWRQATLQALDDCPPQERLRRLEVLSAVQRLPEARAGLLEVWEKAVPPEVPARLAEAVISQAVPTAPSAPTPRHVLAYAELHVLAARPDFGHQMIFPLRSGIASLFDGLLDACDLALEARASGSPGQFTEALTLFVRSYARASGTTDSPDFRALLRDSLRARPAFPRYWQHISEVTDDQGRNLGAVHTELITALADPPA